jgi:hypothetical protein
MNTSTPHRPRVKPERTVNLVCVRPEEVRDTQAFDRIWDRNLKHQGFVAAAEAEDCR